MSQKPLPQPPAPEPPGSDGTTSSPPYVIVDERYTVWTPQYRRFLVCLVGYLCLASSLTATVYFPLIDVLAERYDVSIQAVNLTITLYLVFQGISPAFWLPLSDAWGRRPVYLVNFGVFTTASLALSLVDRNYPALLVLRALQSISTSAILSLGYATVSDTTVHSERGRYLAPLLTMANVGPCIGPVIGGGLAMAAGDPRWSFWALLIFGLTSTILVAWAVPETGRAVVGNGSVPARGVWRTWWSVLQDPSPLKSVSRGLQCWRRRAAPAVKPLPKVPQGHQSDLSDAEQGGSSPTSDKSHSGGRPTGRGRFIFPNPLAPLRIVFYPDTFLVLWIAGSSSALFFCVQTSISPIFANRHGFNPLQVGLCFLAGAAGVLAAGFVSGRLMDYNYRYVARKTGFEIDSVRGDDVARFPIERARTRGTIPILFVSMCVVIGYGWAVEQNLHPAVPLVLQAVIGLRCAMLHQTYDAMVVDVFPEKAGAAAASRNITRCALAGLFVAVLDPMVSAMGYGRVFTLLGMVDAGTSACAVFALNRWGPRWRGKRSGHESGPVKETENSRKS